MKARKPTRLLVGLVSMSDLMFSFSAGLLIMGIFALADPDYEKDFAALLLQVQAAEHRLVELHEATRTIHERHQALLSEEKKESAVSAAPSVSLARYGTNSHQEAP